MLKDRFFSVALAIALLGGFFLTVGPLKAGDTKRNSKPNILLILLDDLGKEWISCYGAEDIHTPHIDALAKGGMTFHKAYSMAQCTPSRATILTGKYPWRNGWVNHWDVPRWGVGYFDWKHKGNTSFATLLKGFGYATCAAGKWQINDFRIEPNAGNNMDKHKAMVRYSDKLVGQLDFATRVIRDKQFKVWVSSEKKITRLHDLAADPLEMTNLIESSQKEHRNALKKFQTVLDALPEKDSRPLYEARKANPWDKKYIKE